MAERMRLILVDPDERRRAAGIRALATLGAHIEPFTGADELAVHVPTRGVILVHDSDGAIEQVTEVLSRAGIWLPIIAYGAGDHPERIVDAVFGGAVDYMALPLSDTSLIDRLTKMAERMKALASTKKREAAAKHQLDRLTPRELEVLRLIAEGKSNRVMALNLGISPRTVEIHRANMLSKIGAKSTADAVRMAMEGSIIADCASAA